MRLFTPLSAAEAEQAERGLLRGQLIWVDRPQPDAAPADAVWVAIDVPDNRLAKFETRADSNRGYRSFLLPSRITNLHQADRVELPD